MILLLAIIILSVVLDQVTKYLAVTYLLPIKEGIPIWKDVFHLTYVENTGAAWGMFSDDRWVFMIISLVGLTALAIYLFRFPPKSQFACISIAMIFGGGVGNMIDRFRLKYVVDFFDFTLIDFPVFNVADSFVTVGAFLLAGYAVYDLIREMKLEKEQAARKQEQERSHDDT